MNKIDTKPVVKISFSEAIRSANKEAQSIAVFNDQLFLADIYSDAERAIDFLRILRYSPEANSWQEVHSTFVSQSTAPASSQPMTAAPASAPVATAAARSTETCYIAVLPPGTSTTAGLYARFTTATTETVVYSKDGNNFQGIESPSAAIVGLLFSRQCLSFHGHLFALPAAASSVFQGKSEVVQVYGPEDAPPRWRAGYAQAFDAPRPLKNSALAAFHGALYAATLNLEQGFQLWQLSKDQLAPLHWTSVLDYGAYRYVLNQSLPYLTAFKGNLYLASGLWLERGQESKNPFYPAGFELLRFYQDGDWDVLVGTPRFTPQGLKVPLSGFGSGFEDPYRSLVECLVVHQDHLYLGLQSLETFQLWRSSEGETWEQLPHYEQLSREGDISVRALLSTSWGLCFGVDVSRPDGTEELEIWLQP